MKFFEQACIPLDLRTDCANAALAYAESVIGYQVAAYQPDYEAFKEARERMGEAVARLTNLSDTVALTYVEAL